MNYEPNMRLWRPGDLVIHDADAKTQEMVSELKQLQKDRPNVGADLTLWALINLLITWFKVMR